MPSTQLLRGDDSVGSIGSSAAVADEAKAATVAGVRYVIATEEMAAEVARLMEQFIEDEPLLVAGGVTTAATRHALEPWMRAQLQRGMSIAAIAEPAGCGGGQSSSGSSSSSQCGRPRLVAVLTCFAATQADGKGGNSDNDEALLLRHWFPHPAVADVEALIDRAETQCDLHNRLSPAAAAADGNCGSDGDSRPLLAIVGQMVVDRAYRGAGVAKRLIAEVLTLARDRGCSALVAAASGAGSQALFRRMQFEECGESVYVDALDASRFDLTRLSDHRALVVFVRDLRSMPGVN